MVDTSDLTVGERVTVTYDSVRDANKAIIEKLPPFTHDVCGEEETVEDKVRVRYPSSGGGSGLLGDMMENVDIEQIE